MRRVVWLPALILIAIVIGAPRPTFAAPIIYTEETMATGSLGGQPFSYADVLLTFTGNTIHVFNPLPGIFVNRPGPATVHVEGIRTATFTDVIQAVDNQPIPLAGFGDVTANRGILFTINADFSTYDLRSPIGPLTGASRTTFGFAFPTTEGSFILNTVGESTFTAE